MKLKLKIQRDGTLRPRWYGAWMTDGRSHETSLCRWRGTPPASFRVAHQGDKVFEESRVRALAELREIAEGERSETDRALLAARAHRARYGTKVRRVKIAGVYDAWRDLPRKRPPSPGRDAVCRGVFDRFACYMAEAAPNIIETGALTSAHFKGFMEAERARGVSARTWNETLSILRGTLAKIDPHSVGFAEYLKVLPKSDEETIHRRPFTEGELAGIFTAAEADPLLHGLIVTAACTAMRRGDVARLRWSCVDLKEGFVTVKTSKTGETIDVPVFPELRKVLEARPPRGAFVFPEAAKLYAKNPDELNRRLRRVLEAAGFIRPPLKPKPTRFPAATPEEISRRTAEHMERAGWGPKRRASAAEILRRHLVGETGREIAAALGTSPGGVSSHLHAIEDLIQLAVVSPPKVDASAGPAMLAEIHPESPRAQRGSLVGWHSFRTTWVTLALSRGVPIEIVRTVTGHRTAEIVLKYYFRPNRKLMRDAIGERMPAALIGGGGGESLAPLPPWALKLVGQLSAKNLATIKTRLLNGAAHT